MTSDKVDQTTVSSARRWNYWLGGKDHFEVDRESGDRIASVYPAVRTAAQQGRAFHNRAVRHLAEAGIRQFLDIGTGLPAPQNTHEVAQRVAPDSRVVYVDNDPMVLTHARALMIGGATTYVDADLKDPAAILGAAELKETIDLDRPVGILLLAVLHFVASDEQAREIVADLLAAVPPGSYLVATNSTKDFVDAEAAARYDAMLAAGHVDAWPRDRATFGRFFDGLELVEPGIVAISDWRPDSENRPAPSEVSMYGAVARKPS
ncbi:SAM-dependent methyltransferase [Actinoplanes flavus]|uniref:SAM-dependent methyltransferase n=1 Tax=Actinoplanes flavus TaxID=2820290 RepID=A0ABS3V088_9ACTN|nr:SAM-dependent methyltransferase [Actinoplanes flavus]MBO3744252.1 SAM-dependent methyltransferase [Actinoplanes flavus]